MTYDYLDSDSEALLKEILENDKNFPAILRRKLQGASYEEDKRLRAIIKVLIDDGYISIPRNAWGDNLPVVGRIEQKARSYFEIKNRVETMNVSKNQRVFISHSSKDIQFVKKFVDFLVLLGINIDNIFCSSVEGQGVSHGKKIEEYIRNEIIEDGVLIYIFSNEFQRSSYCLNELGAGWILSDTRTQSKELFYIKLPNINFDDLKGFVGANDKCTTLEAGSITTFIDELVDTLNLPTKSLAQYHNIINNFIESTKGTIAQPQLSDTQKTEEKKAILRATNIHERKIIKTIYFSKDGTLNLDPTNATVGAMVSKRIIGTPARMYDLLAPCCSYTLQPWVYNLFKEDKDFRNEIIG